jgi:hypothetical protein
VLQTAFGWTDSHLWRFSLGGDPFSSSSQVFLCPWDVEEGEWDDEGGLPAAAIRLDEAVQHPFIVLRDHGLNPRLAALIDRLTYSPVGADLASRALLLLDERPIRIKRRSTRP